MKSNQFHEPVLVEEIVSNLALGAHLNSQVRIIDATLGTGGHSLEFLKRGVRVLGIDIDPVMVLTAKRRFVKETINESLYCLVNGNFRNIDKIAAENHFTNVDGVIFDLGVSNKHLLDSQRGFSFAYPEAELDMRLDLKSQAVKAKDLLNVLRRDQLISLFTKVLVLKQAKLLTDKILGFRLQKQFATVGDFLAICNQVRSKPGLNQATLPFLALRMAVNNELENLTEAQTKAFGLLKRFGRLAIITFHSGEDSLVKESFKVWVKQGLGRMVGKEYFIPTKEEIARNPRSRSAKLRIIEKISYDKTEV